MFVLAFDRDWTVDVNPRPNHEAVPLEWVRYWAHETDHEVWAIGNQDLVDEADIPGTVEAVRRRDGHIEALGEQDDTGYYEWWPDRDERLHILADLFPTAEGYIVVDDLDLSDVEGWDHYHAWEFVEQVQTDEFPLDPPSSGSLRSDGGFESKEEVESVLEEGNLFELTYRTDGDERTSLVTHREPHRPAMSSIKGPPVFYFDAIAGRESHKVRLPELVSLRPVPFDVIPDPLTEDAVTSMEGTARTDPEKIPLSAVEQALTGAEDGQASPEAALQLASVVLDERSTGLEALGDPIFSLLQGTDLDVGRGVLAQFAAKAQESPATVEPHVSELVALVSDSPYREQAARCLGEVAEDHPTKTLDYEVRLS